MARSATTVITSIYQGGKSEENVTIDGVEWSDGDEGTITLSTTVPGTVVVGDVITDDDSNSYLIVSISGADLTCIDFDSTESPAGGPAVIAEAYESLANFASNLDDAVLYRSGDSAVGQAYNIATYTDVVPFTGSGETVGLATILLTVPASERHDGTAGTGVVLEPSGAHAVGIDLDAPNLTVEWIEFDSDSGTINVPIDLNEELDTCVRNLIVHGGTRAGTRYGIFCEAPASTGDPACVLNCLVYDLTVTSSVLYGIYAYTSGGTRAYQIRNNTVFNLKNNSSSDNCYGILCVDSSNGKCQNNIALESDDGSTSGTEADYSVGGSLTEEYNMASDATAAGTGSIDNATAADEFVSTVGGSEDLRLKDAGSQAFEAGKDLGTEQSVNIDIEGRDRDAEGDTWSMGACQEHQGAVGNAPTGHLYGSLVGSLGGPV